MFNPLKIMLMIDLSNMRLFALLAEPSQITNEEMQNAYGDFIGHIKAVSNSDDYSNIFRTLNLTRIELVSVEPAFRYEQGGKCP